jgi:tungstate transport system ATP-binding protein
MSESVANRGQDPVVRFAGVEVRRGGRPILRVPDFRVEPGEILALIGPNGAGKSTLLQVAALLLAPDAGEVWIDGERATKRNSAALRRRSAMVFQSPLLFDVSVLENVTSGLRFRGVRRKDAEAAARRWLDRFGVGHVARRGSRTLSGGEAQRVALARAFATDPAFLLLDEPFAALDTPTRAGLIPDLAARLRETGTAAVIVTHDLAEARLLGDRLGVMDQGELLQLDDLHLVLARPASPRVATFLSGLELLDWRR